MTREECVTANGPPEKKRYNAGLELFEETRGQVRADFDEHDGKLNCLWISKGILVPTFRDLSLFDRASLDQLRAEDPESCEFGPYEHLPRWGIIVGSLGKKKTKEGPLAIIASAERYKMLYGLGRV
jgi:hypothetical protein